MLLRKQHLSDLISLGATRTFPIPGQALASPVQIKLHDTAVSAHFPSYPLSNPRHRKLKMKHSARALTFHLASTLQNISCSVNRKLDILSLAGCTGSSFLVDT